MQADRRHNKERINPMTSPAYDLPAPVGAPRPARSDFIVVPKNKPAERLMELREIIQKRLLHAVL
ncbi:MAG TPA: hypothetical protein VLT92_17345, partial [Burkholderiales bacterium]|nr:hypothetical protein [Burkholderiales bacterium]